MAMIVTSNVEARYRGFLTSVMLKIAPESMWHLICRQVSELECGTCCQHGGWRLARDRSSWSVCTAAYSPALNSAITSTMLIAGRRAGLYRHCSIARRLVESEWPLVNGGGKTCRIFDKRIYRALGVENIRHRRETSRPLLIRRLLSLDYVIEHPGLNWLPAEHEKVQFLISELGLPRRLIPAPRLLRSRGNPKALLCPQAASCPGPRNAATFAYIDPGHATDNELRSWGAAHARLWEALRKAGRRVRVIGIAAEDEPISSGPSGC